jgi:hypothetical protein
MGWGRQERSRAGRRGEGGTKVVRTRRGGDVGVPVLLLELECLAPAEYCAVLVPRESAPSDLSYLDIG